MPKGWNMALGICLDGPIVGGVRTTTMVQLNRSTIKSSLLCNSDP